MLSQSEIRSLEQLYPDLKVKEEEGGTFLEGKLKFRALFDNSKNELIIDQNIICPSNEYLITDEFNIEIEIKDKSLFPLPLVREIGGRIQRIIESKNISDKKDLHINPDGTICLCAKLEEKLRFPNGSDIITFLNQLVVPFFYCLSYYNKNNVWPWGQRSHGNAGIFESYLEYRSTQGVDKKMLDSYLVASPPFILTEKSKEYLRRKNDIKGHWDCICDSRLQFRACHKEALEGMRLFKKDLASLSLKV